MNRRLVYILTLIAVLLIAWMSSNNTKEYKTIQDSQDVSIHATHYTNYSASFKRKKATFYEKRTKPIDSCKSFMLAANLEIKGIIKGTPHDNVWNDIIAKDSKVYSSINSITPDSNYDYIPKSHRDYLNRIIPLINKRATAFFSLHRKYPRHSIGKDEAFDLTQGFLDQAYHLCHGEYAKIYPEDAKQAEQDMLEKGREMMADFYKKMIKVGIEQYNKAAKNSDKKQICLSLVGLTMNNRMLNNRDKAKKWRKLWEEHDCKHVDTHQ